MAYVYRPLNSSVIDNCRCPYYRFPSDSSQSFQSINCIRFGIDSSSSPCGDHDLEVYQVHKKTYFPRPCGFWEDDYEWVTELPNQVVIESVSFYSPPCSGFPNAYRTKTTTQTKTIDAECEGGFGQNCCDLESDAEYGTECVPYSDTVSTYSGANTITQHLEAGIITYYESCTAGDCYNNGTFLRGPFSSFPAFMYGQGAIVKREGYFGLKATGLRVGFKYKYGYTVWRRVQPQDDVPSFSKVSDFRSSFIATSTEEEIDPIPEDWDTMTQEERWFTVSGEPEEEGEGETTPIFQEIPLVEGYQYYINNFGIIQDFGTTSCNAWITGTDDGTTP